MNQTLKANIAILIAAIIWGSAFVTQKMGMDSIGPVFFVAARSFIGCTMLIIVAFIFDKLNFFDEEDSAAQPSVDAGVPTFWQENRKTYIAGGLACGIIMCTAANFQQIGLVSVDAGKSGFLTALYIVLVPLIGILLRKPVHANHLVAAALGVVGLYFLCINGGLNIVAGDLACIVGALFWAFHILVVDHFAPLINPIKLSAAQFFICGVLSVILGVVIGEDFDFSMVASAKFAILYTGIMSSGVGFTLQIVAQRHANPTAASLIMSMEALFATIFGFLFLGERFTSREFAGALFMMVAVIIAQFSFNEIRAMIKRK
ncbi:MAG: DMT family transporter [Firmicutes bacterium]|nr:DMT family transporter [Bacillota bacterium]